MADAEMGGWRREVDECVAPGGAFSGVFPVDEVYEVSFVTDWGVVVSTVRLWYAV